MRWFLDSVCLLITAAAFLWAAAAWPGEAASATPARQVQPGPAVDHDLWTLARRNQPSVRFKGVRP